MAEVYDTEGISHESDRFRPLEHGTIRYIPCDDCPTHIRNQLPSKNDRSFVYVPAGYLYREKDGYMKNILSALHLSLPNMVVVTPETTGSAEEQCVDSYGVQDASSHPVAKDWSDEHCKEVLKVKIGQILESVLESSMEVGAWLLPDCPRRSNGAAQVICEKLPKNDRCVALGLIGLEEEEQDKDFKVALQAAMVPIGSPIENAVKLSFDLNLKDRAPLPQLTHLLIFESPEERTSFRNAILDLLPDFMLAFGNVTREAMTDIFDNVKAGSPVVLIQHSGPNIIKLSQMFRHVNNHMSVSRDSGKIPPILSVDDDAIKLFINTWPIGYNKESVVLSDPLIMSGPVLQKRLLNAISSCFSLKTGGADARLVRQNALKYAWSFYKTANNHYKHKEKASESLHLRFLFFTLLSIMASVFYNQIYGGTGSPDSSMQFVIYVSSILLPLYITSLKQEVDKGTEILCSGAFKIASFRIYSEILKFRTQSGQYSVEEKTEIALQKPIKIFTSTIKEIWSSIEPYLQEDSMSLPDDFWGNTEIPQASPSADLIKSNLPEHPPDETTPILASYLSTSKPSSLDEFDDEDPPELDFVDDMYSPLKVDDYIVCRMQVEMQRKSDEIEKMVGRNNHLAMLIKLITIFSGGCAALSFQWFVPIILGVTAALGAAQGFRKYPHRIEKGNAMIAHLNETKLWWMGLSMYEKQLPQNKDNLILSSERIIVMELESSSEGQSSG